MAHKRHFNVHPPAMEHTQSTIDRPALLKQRRILLAFTFALVVMHLMNVELTGQLSTPVALIKYDPHPPAILFVVWVAWAYSLWRYWQYERSFHNAPFLTDSQREIEAVVAAEAQSAVQKSVDAGTYRPRGLNPGTQVLVRPRARKGYVLEQESDMWEFPSLQIHYRNESGQYTELEGGGSITFSAEEVRDMKRRRDRALAVRYPHFTDYRAPYIIAALAPLSGLIDLGRWAFTNWF